MGTHNMVFVYYRGDWHIAQHGQWDGYPSCQGVEVLTFIRDPANISKLKAVIEAGLLYEPTQQQKKCFEEEAKALEGRWREQDREHWRMFMQYYREKVAQGFDGEDCSREYRPSFKPLELVCPTMCRDTGARILKYAAEATAPYPIVKELGFSFDIEWTYVIDLDEGVLEVFSGVTRWAVINRFQRFEWAQAYHPAHCRGKWTFAELPDDEKFIHHFHKGQV